MTYGLTDLTYYDPLTIEPPKTGGVSTIKELDKLLRQVKVQDLFGFEPDENGIYHFEEPLHEGGTYTWRFTPKDYNKKQPYLRMTGGKERYRFFVTGERYSYFGRGAPYLYAPDGIIRHVSYTKQFPSLQGWMRSVLDPAISNNFDATWVTKTFVFVGKATFTYELVECEGTTLDGAMVNYCQQNPAVQYGLQSSDGRFSRYDVLLTF